MSPTIILSQFPQCSNLQGPSALQVHGHSGGGITIFQTASPVHGLGGVVLEPEDEGDIVGAARLGHVTGQHARQTLEPRHRQDRN